MLPLKLSYQPDFQHLFKASAALARHRYTRGHRLRANLMIYGSMVVSGIFSATAGILLHRFLLPQVPDYVLIFVFFVLCGLFYAKVLVPKLYRSSAKYVNEVRVRRPMQFTADETGLRWQDDDIDFLLHWRGVEGVYATPDSLSFLTGVIALVVPLGAFPDQPSRKSFLTDVLERITPEAAEKSRQDSKLKALLD